MIQRLWRNSACWPDPYSLLSFLLASQDHKAKAETTHSGRDWAGGRVPHQSLIRQYLTACLQADPPEAFFFFIFKL